jgi:hypothetical protein
MFEAGYAEKNITLDLGTDLTGFGFYPGRRVESVLDDLKVRALCVRNQGGVRGDQGISPGGEDRQELAKQSQKISGRLQPFTLDGRRSGSGTPDRRAENARAAR